MSIKVIVKDKLSGTKLDVNNVLIDDSLIVTKEKLFAFTEGISYYPNFIKIETDKKTITNKSGVLMFQWETLPTVPVIFVTNILEEIKQKYDVFSLYNQLDDQSFLQVFDTLQKEYIDFTEEDLEFVVKLLVFQNNPSNALQELIREQVEKLDMQKEKIEEMYFQQMDDPVYLDYIQRCETSDFNDFLNFQKTFFSSLTFMFKPFFFQSGIRGRYIKLDQIFNQLELSEFIPFLAIASEDNPKIKVLNNLTKTVSDREIKSWVLNEKKKSNVMSYKKIKGILLKCSSFDGRYMTVNLFDNGIITAKITYDTEDQTDFEKIKDQSIKIVNKVVDTITPLSGVFMKSKRLVHAEESVISLESVSGSFATEKLIHKTCINKLLTDRNIAEVLFSPKDIVSDDIISMYYKKFNDGNMSDTDRQGITVNIKDNPFVLNSSIITIYNALSLNQMYVIAKQIAILTKTKEYQVCIKDALSKQKIKEKSHIKDLRKQGVTILSTKCQKPRQPVIDANLAPLTNSYVLEYNGKKYVCPKKDYPYPGFTNDNIPCCFKKDKRTSPQYIRNVRSSNADILVEPSNFVIQVNKDFQTHAIRVVSDYLEGFDETNSASRYYFINQKDVLEPITNPQLVETLMNMENTIWLDPVPLTTIINSPPKNKCSFPPDFKNKKQQDVNAVCAHHDKNNFFGYNLNSYPCCFDKPRDVELVRKRKDVDITKQHILTTDKVLDHQRIGTLPLGLDQLFNSIIEHNANLSYYRMGVVQNQYAFLNAVILAAQERLSVRNATDLKKKMIEYLEQNNNAFFTLNSGEISNKFSSIQAYINHIQQEQLSWNDVIDLLSKMIQRNILLIDIPYKTTNSNKVADYENIKLICTPFLKMNEKIPYIILLKKLNTFEVVIGLKSNADGSSYIKYHHNYNQQSTPDKNIVNFLVEYNKQSCVRENVYPENYTYDELLLPQLVINVLQGTSHDIVYQLLDSFNKTVFLINKKGIIIPVLQTGALPNLKSVDFNTFIQSDKLLPIEKYISELSRVNKLLPTKLKIIGATTSFDDATQKLMYTGILTNFGQMVPVKVQEYQSIDNIPVLNFKYYPQVDKLLSSTIESHNKQQEFTENFNAFKQKVFQIKVHIAANLTDTHKKELFDIISSTSIPRSQKIIEMVRIFKDYDNSSEEILKNISNAMLNDNVENLLLNNMVVPDSYNMAETIQRDSESILLNITDIKKWLKKFS